MTIIIIIIFIPLSSTKKVSGAMGASEEVRSSSCIFFYLMLILSLTSFPISNWISSLLSNMSSYYIVFLPYPWHFMKCSIVSSFKLRKTQRLSLYFHCFQDLISSFPALLLYIIVDVFAFLNFNKYSLFSSSSNWMCFVLILSDFHLTAI